MRAYSREVQLGQFLAVAEGAIGDDGGRAADLQAGRQHGAGGRRAGIVAAVDDEHLARTDILDRLPLQVGRVRVGRERGVGVHVLAGRDHAQRKRLARELGCLRVHRLEADQKALAQTFAEQLGRERATADVLEPFDDLRRNLDLL